MKENSVTNSFCEESFKSVTSRVAPPGANGARQRGNLAAQEILRKKLKSFRNLVCELGVGSFSVFMTANDEGSRRPGRPGPCPEPRLKKNSVRNLWRKIQLKTFFTKSLLKALHKFLTDFSFKFLTVFSFKPGSGWSRPFRSMDSQLWSFLVLANRFENLGKTFLRAPQKSFGRLTIFESWHSFFVVETFNIFLLKSLQNSLETGFFKPYPTLAFWKFLRFEMSSRLISTIP